MRIRFLPGRKAHGEVTPSSACPVLRPLLQQLYSTQMQAPPSRVLLLYKGCCSISTVGYGPHSLCPVSFVVHCPPEGLVFKRDPADNREPFLKPRVPGPWAWAGLRHYLELGSRKPCQHQNQLDLGPLEEPMMSLGQSTGKITTFTW